MPTILRLDGFRFYFYSHEPNEPRHVHVDRAGCSAKLWLEPVSLAGNAGFSAAEIGVLLKIVRAHRAQFTEAWDGFFGAGR
ncbi:MAG: DUF4160 domain-containing protein [Pseudomonadota bacterium]